MVSQDLMGNQDGQSTAKHQYIRLQTIHRGTDPTSHWSKMTHTSETSQPTGPHHAAHCSTCRQANKEPWPNWHHITFQPTFPTRCHMKEANCPGEPSKYFCPRHPVSRRYGSGFHHRLHQAVWRLIQYRLWSTFWIWHPVRELSIQCLSEGLQNAAQWTLHTWQFWWHTSIQNQH